MEKRKVCILRGSRQFQIRGRQDELGGKNYTEEIRDKVGPFPSLFYETGLILTELLSVDLYF